jgi:hypothetical protein
MDSSALRRAAQQTAGRYYTFATAAELPRDLDLGQSLLTERLAPVPLWNKWPLLALVLALLSAEWYLRTRVGMV